MVTIIVINNHSLLYLFIIIVENIDEMETMLGNKNKVQHTI